MDFFGIFGYSFFQNALLVGLLVWILCPIMGVFIMMKRYAMIADTLGHVSLTGIALWLLLGISPIVTTTVYSLVSAVGMDRLRSGRDVPSDAVLSLFLSGNLALAILLLSFSKNFWVNLHAYLFWSILTVERSDVWILAAIVVLVLVSVYFLFHELVAVSMDADHAATQGVNVSVINTVLILLISLTVTAAILVVGILLVWALLVLPVLAASLIAKNLKQTAQFSIWISLFSMFLGIIFSFILNVPPSAVITLLLVVIFLLLKIVNRLFLWFIR